MTLEELYTARTWDTSKFISKLKTNPDFEREYYDWVDYFYSRKYSRENQS